MSRWGDPGFQPPAKPSLWLALSGGGFRAALYGFGCLKRLHELGLLDSVGYLSATSGGAFAAASWLAEYDPTDRETSWGRFERRFLLNVRRGVLLPTELLIGAYVCYASAALAIVLSPRGVAAPLMAACGLALHILLFGLLVKDGAHRRIEGDHDRNPRTAGQRARRPILSMLFKPSATRWQTLDVRVFDGATLLQFERQAAIPFFTAIDVLSGTEFVFSPRVVAPLTLHGCRVLWDQLPESKNVTAAYPIAQVVAANMAVPPLFRPVRIQSDVFGFGTGHFIDSGIVDNLAVHVPLTFSVYLEEGEFSLRTSKYGVAFSKAVGHLLLVDASAEVAKPQSESWPRLRSIFRLLDVIQSHQVSRAFLALASFTRANVPNAGIGLRIGYIRGSDLFDDDLSRYVAQTRTNLDSFSLTECAAIAYCGYTHTDVWFHDHEAQLTKAFSAIPSECRRFADFLDPTYGRYHTEIADLKRHMKAASSQFSIVRQGKRLIAHLRHSW